LSGYLDQHPDDRSARSILALAFFRSADYQKVIDTLAPIRELVQATPELRDAYDKSIKMRGQK
jgi:hypothetical protein